MTIKKYQRLTEAEGLFIGSYAQFKGAWLKENLTKVFTHTSLTVKEAKIEPTGTVEFTLESSRGSMAKMDAYLNIDDSKAKATIIAYLEREGKETKEIREEVLMPNLDLRTLRRIIIDGFKQQPPTAEKV